MGSKIGTLAEVAGIAEPTDGAALSRDVAMQVAAMNPLYIRREDVPKDVIEHELEIYRTQARNEHKPEPVIDRIATGRLEKFYQEVCLLEQSFIKDAGKTVKDLLGGTGAIRSFFRYHLGENQ
jgi:elongation factor Ts